MSYCGIWLAKRRTTRLGISSVVVKFIYAPCQAGQNSFRIEQKCATAKIKTTQNEASVEAFLNSIADEQQRADSFKIDEMMQRVSGEKPKMWGPSLIGYGFRHIVSPSGRGVDWFIIGFSPRKGNLSLYVSVGKMDGFDKLLSRLGKHKTGMGCLYIKRLSDIDEAVLEELVSASFSQNRER